VLAEIADPLARALHIARQRALREARQEARLGALEAKVGALVRGKPRPSPKPE
jgi:hypothetical protein